MTEKWTPKFFFETLIPLVREKNPAITTTHDFMVEARKIVFEFSDDGSAEERFRIDVERVLNECQVLSDLTQETRSTFSSAQRRSLYKDWLDNMEDPAEVKAIGDLLSRQHLAQQTKYKLHALNDQEYFLIREYIDFVIEEADKTRESFAVCKPTIAKLTAKLTAMEKQIHGKRDTPNGSPAKRQKKLGDKSADKDDTGAAELCPKGGCWTHDVCRFLTSTPKHPDVNESGLPWLESPKGLLYKRLRPQKPRLN